VWGICSPTYAKISRRNLQYPGACSGDSLFNTGRNQLGLFAPHPLLNQVDEFVTAEEFYLSPEPSKQVYVETIPRNKTSFSLEDSYPYIKKDVVIEKMFEKKRVFNLTTSTRTFIANGILVHNCYEINKKHRIMPLEYAKKFIDIILTDPDPIACTGTDDHWIIERGLILDFIGGDSFMHIDLVDKILSYYVYKVNTIVPSP
jgi:hypothetical protein